MKEKIIKLSKKVTERYSENTREMLLILFTLCLVFSITGLCGVIEGIKTIVIYNVPISEWTIQYKLLGLIDVMFFIVLGFYAIMFGIAVVTRKED